MGIAILDLDGFISQVNPAFYRITGIDPADNLEGKKLSDVENTLVEKMLGVKLGENEVVRCGDVRAYRCWHLNFLQTGFYRRFYLVESLTEELMQAERAAYEKVIRVMSHEVNNTMGGVRSVLTMLAENQEDTDIAEVLESCDERCGALCEFIKSYADVVRLPEPVISSIDLSSLIHGMSPFLHTLAGEDVTIEILNPEREVTAKIDSGLMQQAILNIVKNAAESFADSDRDKRRFIRIRIEDTHSGPMIEISNNGPAISESVSRSLFSPFFSTKRDGRGIGLTLTAEILRMHGAVYSLRTDSDGITRFSIRL